jgi:hypothetical protein
VPGELGPWLLEEGAANGAAQVWVDLAAVALLTSLTNEVEANGELVFRGPPGGCEDCPPTRLALAQSRHAEGDGRFAKGGYDEAAKLIDVFARN